MTSGGDSRPLFYVVHRTDGTLCARDSRYGCEGVAVDWVERCFAIVAITGVGVLIAGLTMLIML
jgi:hypothetical protein